MQNNNIIKPCVIERKWRHCNVFISSSPCNVFTVMYSCFWQSENEDIVLQKMVNFSKFFCFCLHLMIPYLNNSVVAIAAGNTGEYCPLWRNFQPMASRKYRECLHCPLTQVIRPTNNFPKNLALSVVENYWQIASSK